MKNVTIFTTPTCVYCKMTKAFLTEHNVPFTVKDVSADDAAREEMIKKSGQMAVPVIDIEGQILVGFDKEGLTKSLNITA
ncbi:glutaredoxin family protein [Candidatus Berkelbacteria bacterium]|nr:glutaredoxin family protein [Candidatus Berkelbacteria bacterium]